MMNDINFGDSEMNKINIQVVIIPCTQMLLQVQ